MMKKLLMLLLSLCLVCSPLAGLADNALDAAQNALCTIVLRQDGADIPLGSGVIVLRGDLLLTAESCLQEGDLYAISENGTFRVTASTHYAGAGVGFLHLEGEAGDPLPLATMTRYALPALMGIDAQGNALTAELYRGMSDVYRYQGALRLFSEEGLMPGAVMVDETGALMALAVTQHGEGVGQYIAMDAELLSRILPAAGEKVIHLMPECSWEGGLLTIAWEDTGKTDGVYYVTFSGDENSYYTFLTVDAPATQVTTAVAPGHGYNIQVRWLPDEKDAANLDWLRMAHYDVPAAAPLTAHGFTQDCYGVFVPADDPHAGHERQERFTVAQAMNAKLTGCLQIHNTYDVDGEIELPMVMCLTAPDGQFYFYEGGYLFSPEYETSDDFCVSLADQWADCAAFSEGRRILPGQYTLSYYIGGELGGECTLTLTDDQP